MAELPTLASLGQRPIPQARTGVRSLQGANVGQAVSGLASAVTGVGDMIADRNATAQAKERDTYVADEIRTLLYDPETGFANLEGRAAVDKMGEIEEALDRIESEAGNGLNNIASRKLEGSLAGRMERARDFVSRHTGSERKTWMDGASEARVVAAQQDALFNPHETQTAINTIAGEVADQQRRDGLSDEEADLILDTKVSQLYQAQIENLASSDPINALRYLQLNEKEILPSVRAELLARLKPEAARFKGRQAGRAAAELEQAGPRGGYFKAIRAAESGGNDSARNPNSSATGRYQFTTGTWALMMKKHPELGLTEHGRTDPAQQELAIRAFTEDNARVLAASGIDDTNANLYAAHFLGAGSATNVLTKDDSVPLSELVSGKVIDANPFLANMTVGDFKQWTEDKSGGPPADGVQVASAGGMRDLIDIKDPVERQAAIQEYNLAAGVAQQEARAAQDAALNSAWEVIDQGGDINAMPHEMKQQIGLSGVRALQQYQAGLVQTDPGFKTALWELYARDPQAFMDQDPTSWLGNLDRQDYDKFVQMRAKMIAGDTQDIIKAPTVSTMMSTADAALRGASITKTNQPQQYSAFQNDLTEWATSNPDKANDPVALQKQINAMLVPVVLNPPGLRNEQEGRAFEIDLDGSALDPTDDITLETLFDSTIKINSTKVPDAMLTAIVNSWRSTLGRDPTPEEIMEELVASPFFE